jgi:hypothetical protein
MTETEYRELVELQRAHISRLQEQNVRLNKECDHYINVASSREAEIERLLTELDLAKAFYKEKEAEFSLLNYKYNKTLNQLNDYQSIARAEAIREFVDKLETELIYFEEHFIEVQDWSARNTIRQVISAIKEMVGEG